MSNSSRKFVADNMLGKLARWMRLLGCDVYYDNVAEDSELLAIALDQKRILLTRDHELAERAGESGYLVETEGTENQLAEIILTFDIEPRLYGDRCPNCNGVVREVPKKTIEDYVPQYTYMTHEKFRQCNDCGQVFWEGSHRALAEQNLLKLLEQVEDK